MRTLSLADDGTTVELRPGETLAIRLPENAATGYAWAAEPVDAGKVELLPAEAEAGGAKAIGSGGETLFRLRARKPGRTELRLRHWREWEGEPSIRGTFRLNLLIGDGD